MLKTIATCAAVLLIWASMAQAAEPPTASPSGSPAACSTVPCEPRMTVSPTSPPSRPVPLTTAQFEALRSVQNQPEHSSVVETSATYSAREERLQWTRFSDDVWTAIYQVGWPGTYLAIALCAI